MERELIEERWEVWTDDNEKPSTKYLVQSEAYVALVNLRTLHPKLKYRIKHVRRYRGPLVGPEARLARAKKLGDQLAAAVKKAVPFAHSPSCDALVRSSALRMAPCNCGVSEIIAAAQAWTDQQ